MATFPSAIPPYPVHVEGHLQRPSRWLWLVKWLLAIPHYFLLAFLWLAFFFSAVVSFFAVMFTGRYPRELFEFNVGVMRWSWRVAFYAYGANGTDRYPPFTLADVPDYPARLEVEYPQHHRRGISVLGWWLAGIPQYVIASLFIGTGGTTAWWSETRSWGGVGWFGLAGFLVLVAAIVLLFRGTYPRSIFDFVLGLNRWALRVIAYAAVMTPEYPPFRLDPGENDPAGPISVLPPPAPQPAAGSAAAPAAGASAATGTAAASAAEPSSAGPAQATAAAGTPVLRWTPGRVLALALIVAGGAGLVFDQTQRDRSGYLMSSAQSYSTPTYAVVSDNYRAGAAGDWFVARDLLGTVRVRTTSARPVFVGIAPAAAAEAYMQGVAHKEVAAIGTPGSGQRVVAGGAPAAPPASLRIWSASMTGAGQQTLTWPVRKGDWRVVVMNPDATQSVSADVSVGARFPHLLTIAIVVLGVGLVVLALSGSGFYAVIRRVGGRT